MCLQCGRGSLFLFNPQSKTKLQKNGRSNRQSLRSSPTTVTDEISSSQVESIEEEVVPEKNKYPYVPLFFLLSTTVGQRSDNSHV